MRDAIASGAIDMAPFGTAPLLAAWEKGKDTAGQILAVSGVTSLPLVLLSNQPNAQSIADLKPTDRIAMPTLSSPQMYLLELQSEKAFRPVRPAEKTSRRALARRRHRRAGRRFGSGDGVFLLTAVHATRIA